MSVTNNCAETGVLLSSGGYSGNQCRPVAIVGMACRFPGAPGLDAFWKLLVHSREAIAEVPRDRFDLASIYAPVAGTPGRLSSRWGGFLPNIDRFDNEFFGISPREAAYMDPQQRMLLEVAWEAIEDAGQLPETLAGSNTGVFVGLITADYEDAQYYLTDRNTFSFYTAIGGYRSVLAGRVSFFFDLRGPSICVDTACSSSLVAVHLACQSIASGESSLAIAAGTNLVILPEPSLGFSHANMLSADGRCKFGDHRADGFVRSDGIGVLVLKPLAKALADNDPVYAVILGSAVNNDGHSSGSVATPAVEGQKLVLQLAYRDAGIGPGLVSYVEAHGTGTRVGDPVELGALSAIVNRERPRTRPCFVGSVKTNIGHTEAAAGIAGVIKTALALKHRQIPASLHVQKPNPEIPWQDFNLKVPRELTPWPTGPAIAGVSSFGLSGTNAHVVLQEAPPRDEQEAPVGRTHLFTLSASSEPSLRALAEKCQAFFREDDARALRLSDICFTRNNRRHHHDQRLAVVAECPEEIRESLAAFLAGEPSANVSSGRIPSEKPKLAFVFPGQGSQWLGMARELLRKESVFAESMAQCAQAICQHANWSLIDELHSDTQACLTQIDVVQPTLFAIEVSLSALWESWGITPDAVVGHSMGEIAAAHRSGILSLDDAARVICRRSRLLKRKSGRGAMAMLDLTRAEAERVLNQYKDQLAIAVSNSRSSTVVSGDPDAVHNLVNRLQNEGVFCRHIKVDVASHSPQMDELLPDLLRELQGMNPQQPEVPFYSTVLGRHEANPVCNAEYWAENLRRPVLFVNAVEQLLETGHTVFLEMSPHPILLAAVQQAMHDTGRKGAVLPSLRREEGEQRVMLGSLGALYTLGCPISWDKVSLSAGRCISLPAYAWQAERFWRDDFEFSAPRSTRRTAGSHDLRHPFLASYLTSAPDGSTRFFNLHFDLASAAYIKDHRVQGMIVIPAAAYIEIILSAAALAWPDTLSLLQDLTFVQAAFLREGEVLKGQLVLQQEGASKATFQLFTSRTEAEQKSSTDSWTLNVSGRILFGESAVPSLQTRSTFGQLRGSGTPERSAEQHYIQMAELGLDYGPGFRTVSGTWLRENGGAGKIRLATGAEDQANLYTVHPSLLDGCLQIAAAFTRHTRNGHSAGCTYLPVQIKELVFHRAPAGSLWAECLPANGSNSADSLTFDLFISDDEQRPVAHIRELKLREVGRLESAGPLDTVINPFYRLQWRTSQTLQSLSDADLHKRLQGTWIIFADSAGIGGELQQLLEAHGSAECVLVEPGAAYQQLHSRHFIVQPDKASDYQQLLREPAVKAQPVRGIVHLWSMNASSAAGISTPLLDQVASLGCISIMHLVQALASWDGNTAGLWLVSRGAQTVSEEVPTATGIAQAPLWGLGRTLVNEHPELDCHLLDLGPQAGNGDSRLLFDELAGGSPENQVALRPSARLVARLAQEITPSQPEVKPVRTVDGAHPYHVEITNPGVLDNLHLSDSVLPAPAANQVTIRVRAAALNFIDVMKSLGIYPGQSRTSPDLGLECSGTIAAVSAGEQHWRIGDEVIAIGQRCLGSYAITDADLIFPKPRNLTFEQAAAVPIVFLTAAYALEHLGRLKAGERVLIHSAAGGVGLAAIQLAQRANAEVFCTAGTKEKREFLKSLGLKHVFDSHALDFADDVLQATSGEGVDVVLNSLSGEAIDKGISLLRSGGRFLEIGKADIYRNKQVGLGSFRKNLSFFAIDLEYLLFKSNREILVGLLQSIVQQFQQGALKPLPQTSFKASQAVDGFRSMAKGLHIGKILITFQEDRIAVACSAPSGTDLKPDCTYLITGGLGALGLAVAGWMVDKGARNIALLGRSEPGLHAKEAMARLIARGACVKTLQADVADERALPRALAALNQSMPPLKGIVHAAGLLEDGILLQLDEHRFRKAMLPKVNGAWNLHTLTSELPLDLFVMFSSAACLIGSPGQSNYSAGNAFMDALAIYRRASGRKAISINWGPWSEIGLAIGTQRGTRLAQRGVGSLSPNEALQAMEQVLRFDWPAIAVMPFNAEAWQQSLPATRHWPLFSELQKAETKAPLQHEQNAAPGTALAGKEEPEQKAFIQSYLIEQLARTIRQSASKIDPQRPLIKLGVDSLMAVELRNHINADLGVAFPIAKVIGAPSITVLAGQLLQELAASRQAGNVRSRAAAAGTHQKE